MALSRPSKCPNPIWGFTGTTTSDPFPHLFSAHVPSGLVSKKKASGLKGSRVCDLGLPNIQP